MLFWRKACSCTKVATLVDSKYGSTDALLALLLSECSESSSWTCVWFVHDLPDHHPPQLPCPASLPFVPLSVVILWPSSVDTGCRGSDVSVNLIKVIIMLLFCVIVIRICALLLGHPVGEDDCHVWGMIRCVQLILASHASSIGLLSVEIIGCIVSVCRVEILLGVVTRCDSSP